jgi:ATPase subunit of ABC transporter with duplicated ATPase domains
MLIASPGIFCPHLVMFSHGSSSRRLSHFFRSFQTRSDVLDSVEEEEDVDVVLERERVQRQFGEDGISILRLRKSFQDKVAVNNLSLGISQGEIFGLLGPNVSVLSVLFNISNSVPGCWQKHNDEDANRAGASHLWPGSAIWA